jgi:uncharacterized membrane protein YphA (DoxX/SURF4 family)
MHLLKGQMMAGIVPIPGGVFWVYFTGLAMIAAVVSLWTGKLTKISMILLGILLLIYALSIHLPGALKPETAMMSLPSLYKDLGLSGAAFFLSSCFSAKENKTGA